MSSRDFWFEYFRARGVNPEDSVTKRTDLLIVGDDPGETKIEKAFKYGTPMISWPMFCYLGLAEDRGRYRLTSIPQDFMQDVLISMILTTELLYAKAITESSKRHFESFVRSAAAVEALLHEAWYDPRPTNPEVEHVGLADSARSL